MTTCIYPEGIKSIEIFVGLVNYLGKKDKKKPGLVIQVDSIL